MKVNREAFEVASTGQGTKLITDVVISPAKARTYDLVRSLFNNYALDEKLIES